MAECRKMLGTKSKDAEVEAQVKSRNLVPKQCSDFRKYFSGGVWLAAIFAGVFLLHFRNRQQNMLSWHDEIVAKRVYHIQCLDEEYSKLSNKFGDCVPTQCKRIVKDGLFQESDVGYLKGLANRIFEYGQSERKHSFVSLHTGQLFKINKYKDIYKLADAKQLFTERDFDMYGKISNLMKEQVSLEFQVPLDKLYFSNNTFIARIDNEKPYNATRYMHPHVDKPKGASKCYTALLYMDTYKEDFEGGRLVFMDEYSNQTIEPKKGRLMMFTSGSENLHTIEHVMSGYRMTFTLQFTCDRDLGYSNPTLKNFKV